MVIMKPVFTLIALNHKVFNMFKRMRFFAVAIAIKEVLIVKVLEVFIV